MIDTSVMVFSIIEFVVYGLITYGTLLFMIYSSMNKIEIKKDYSAMRISFVVPALILSLVLSTMSPEIILFEETEIISSDASTDITKIKTSVINLQNPVWGMIHYSLSIIFLFYIILNVLGLLFKKDDAI